MTIRVESRAVLRDREPQPREAQSRELQPRELQSRELQSREPARAEAPGHEPSSWIADVRRVVDRELAAFFADRRERTRRIGGDGTGLVDAIAELTMRGGKRLRPAVLHAAHRALGGDPADPSLLRLSASLELLQSYLLIHDDWMDRDDERRGGPAVHAALRARTGQSHLGDSLAILSGDLASAYAWELVFDASRGLACAPALIAAFVRMHQDVVLGQELDLLATRDVSRMQKLKTGSYTVEGPLRLGAILAGGSDAELSLLEAFGTPLGEAFQVRDDLLGAFGDPSRTGKPRGNDLRAGKRTVLVLECERASSADDRALLAEVLGRHDAGDADVGRVLSMLERTGVRARVEARLETLLTTARAALVPGSLRPEGERMLLDLVEALALRDA